MQIEQLRMQVRNWEYNSNHGQMTEHLFDIVYCGPLLVVPWSQVFVRCQALVTINADKETKAANGRIPLAVAASTAGAHSLLLQA